MSRPVSSGHQRDQRVLVDLGWRAAVVVIAAVVVVLELPAGLRAPASIAAVLVTGDAFVRRHRAGRPLEPVLIAVGAGLAALVLLGLLLNVLPSGLNALGWGLGLMVMELAVLLTLALRRPADGAAVRGRPTLAAAGWAAGAAVVLTGALVWSVGSFEASNIEPLAISATTEGDGSATLTVSSGRTEEPYRLILVTTSGSRVLAEDIEVGPGADFSTKVTGLEDERALLQLVPMDGNGLERELILDSGDAASTS